MNWTYYRGAMKKKCDKCDKPASIFLTDIEGGQKIERSLCEDCASNEGITVKANVPISQLLEDFVFQSSRTEEFDKLTCDVCGISFEEFRQSGLLGCPNDYDAFERVLLPLVERAQEGASHHLGKTPRHAGNDQKKQTVALRLRAELKDAIAREDYERAAALRDQIKEMD